MTDQVQAGPAGAQGVATPQDQTSAQPASTTGAAQENAQAATPQYVTVEQLSQVTEQIVSRLKQSDKDRAARINSEIAGIKQRLDGTGVSLAPEQELKLRDKIGEEIDNPSDGQQAGQASPPPVDQLIAQFVGDVFAEVGTPVTPNDPEWKDLQAVIDATYNDPKGAIKVTRAAIDAANKKAQRVTANAGNAAATIGAGGAQANNTPSAASATDLWKQAYN